MTRNEIMQGLLQDIVDGFKKIGYEEAGGSELFRILHDKKENCVKVFLNNYANPEYVVVRYSVNQELEAL